MRNLLRSLGLGVWKSYQNLGHLVGSLAKLNNNTTIYTNLKPYGQPGECCGKHLPAWRSKQEYQLVILQAWGNF